MNADIKTPRKKYFDSVGKHTIKTEFILTVSCPMSRNSVSEHNNLQFNCIGCLVYDYEHRNSTCLLVSRPFPFPYLQLPRLYCFIIFIVK